MRREEDEKLFKRYINNLEDYEENKRLFNNFLNKENTEEKNANVVYRDTEKKNDYALFKEYLEKGSIVKKDEYIEPAKNVHKKKIKLTEKNLTKIKIMDELDLHGKTQNEAENALKRFMKNAYDKKLSPLLIIHGKGLHSGGKGVLKELVHSYLKHEGKAFVNEYRKAPNQKGGSGATFVWIRKN